MHNLQNTEACEVIVYYLKVFERVSQTSHSHGNIPNAPRDCVKKNFARSRKNFKHTAS